MHKLHCPLCRSRHLHYQFSLAGSRVVQCADCTLLFLNPHCLPNGRRALDSISESIANTVLKAYNGGRVMEWGSDRIKIAAQNLEIHHTSVHEGSEEVPGDLLIIHNLHQESDPLGALMKARDYLSLDGELLLLLPVVDNSSEKTFPANCLTYFSLKTARTAIWMAGYDLVNEEEINKGIVCFRARRGTFRPASLSIILPVFNEVDTIRQVLEGLTAKKFDLPHELIVVESNSTDGTKEIVKEFEGRKNLRIVYQEEARGKGLAVREGLMRANGGIFLIQDADMEYDIEDYESLLEPILRGREAFILGARHGGKNLWKLRRFDGEKHAGFLLNIGHLFFAGLINVLFWQSLRDPFTMYKVFRRDCIHGLEFYCRRFDFDIELVLKIIGNGYQPVEIPVNYTSRGFKEGKKVRVFSDPLTWLRAIFLQRIGKL